MDLSFRLLESLEYPGAAIPEPGAPASVSYEGMVLCVPHQRVLLHEGPRRILTASITRVTFTKEKTLIEYSSPPSRRDPFARYQVKEDLMVYDEDLEMRLEKQREYGFDVPVQDGYQLFRFERDLPLFRVGFEGRIAKVGSVQVLEYSLQSDITQGRYRCVAVEPHSG